MKFIKINDEIINLEKIVRCDRTRSTLRILLTDGDAYFFYENKAKWLWEKLEAMCIYDYEQDMEDKEIIQEYNGAEQ